MCDWDFNKDDFNLSSYGEHIGPQYEIFNGELDETKLSAIQNSEQDTDEYKIRYRYTKGTSKTPKNKGRQFCRQMLSLSSSGRVYRKEDIIKMGNDGVNKKFGHAGKPYSIWDYKGGVNCYHRWERVIFRKKRQENGNLYGGNPMQNTDYINVNQARRQGAKIPKNNKDVAKAPINMPNNGAYPE